jgi:hypothetical protein
VTLAETKPLEPRGEAAPSPLSRITSLFKRPAAHDDFPTSESYTGALSALGLRGELPAEAMDARVAAYHPGHSESVVVEETRPEPEKKLVIPKGYPVQGPAYEGALEQLHKRRDAEGLALSSLVSAYHLGKSDDVPHKAAAPAEADTTEPSTATKATALQKITGIFARQPHHEDFPHSEPFDGPLDGLAPGAQLTAERIDSHVAVYHTTGRSDQPALEPVVAAPPPSETEKKQEGVSRIASLFAPKKVSKIYIYFFASLNKIIFSIKKSI